MTTTEIKKELYKQKPIAIRTDCKGDYVHYVTQLIDNSIVEFKIPEAEAHGFDNKIKAQLLIRWMVTE